MTNKKTWLLTVALNFTYEMEIECDEDTADLIVEYPSKKNTLPPEILENIEQAGDYGKLVDDYAEVVEIEDADCWRCV